MNKTHDNLIISILLKSNGAIRQKYLDNKDKYINLTNYLDNRYEDSDSLRETVARMRFNVEHKPLCPACGKKLLLRKYHITLILFGIHIVRWNVQNQKMRVKYKKKDILEHV